MATEVSLAYFVCFFRAEVSVGEQRETMSVLTENEAGARGGQRTWSTRVKLCRTRVTPDGCVLHYHARPVRGARFVLGVF